MELLEQSLTERIIGACMDVSNELGPGFLESVYQKALGVALEQRRLEFRSQPQLPVYFRGHLVGEFIADYVVGEKVVLELKALNALNGEHEAQVINYLKASGIHVGLLVNFGKYRLEWKRLVF